MADLAEDSDALPTSIGPYRVEGLLGQGSTCRVYRAHDVALDRPVAVKLLTKRLEAEARGRFVIEAQAAGRLVHPNVIQVYAAGEHEGQAYIVQELVDGLPLSELIERRGTLSPESVVEIGIQAAEALACAAEANVLHRDVKPQNLLVSEAGEVKLADFGVAKIVYAPSALTEEGTTLGTPHYMSPEQGKAGVLDARSDQYSLGATLYHLITGQPPFDAENTLALLLMHLTEPLVPVRQRAADCPPGLARAIERMLMKSPDDRYQSFEAVIEALEASGDGVPEAELGEELEAPARAEPAPVVPPAPQLELAAEVLSSDAWGRRAPAALAALATTAVVGLILLSDTHPSARATRIPAQAVLPVTVRASLVAAPREPEPAAPREPEAAALAAPTAPTALVAAPPAAAVAKPPAPHAAASPAELTALLTTLERGGPPAVTAAQALGRLGDHDATPALLKQLAAADLSLAIASAEALGVLADVRAVAPLEDLAQHGSSAKLREVAAAAKRRLWQIEEEAETRR